MIKCFCGFLETALHAGGEGPGDHGSAPEGPDTGGAAAAATHQRLHRRTPQEEEDVAVPHRPMQ